MSSKAWHFSCLKRNTNIVVCVDHGGDGMIEVMEDGKVKQLRLTSTAYTIPEEGEKAIKLWD